MVTVNSMPWGLQWPLPSEFTTSWEQQESTQWWTPSCRSKPVHPTQFTQDKLSQPILTHFLLGHMWPYIRIQWYSGSQMLLCAKIWFTNKHLAKYCCCLQTLHQLMNMNMAIFPRIVEWIKFVNRGTTASIAESRSEILHDVQALAASPAWETFFF